MFLRICVFFAFFSIVFFDASLAFSLNKKIKSWVAMRDENVVKQKFDYSCGSSALATLMNFYFGDQVTEVELLKEVFSGLDEKQKGDRLENGLSLLDLKKIAEQHGYQAVGLKLPLKALGLLQGPVLVYLEHREYKHFSIFKGMREDRIYLADPSLGNTRIAASRFVKMWDGTTLILGKKKQGLKKEHPLKVQDQVPVRNELLAARKVIYKHY